MGARARFRALLDFGVTPELELIDTKHVRMTNFLALAAAAAIGLWVPISFAAGQWLNGLQNATIAAVYLCVLPLNRRERHGVATSLLAAATHVQMFYAVWMFGLPSGAPFHYAALMVGPYLVFRRRFRSAAHLFAALAILVMLGIVVFPERFPTPSPLFNTESMLVINTALSLGMLLFMTVVFVRTVDQTEVALQEARARADALLLNVLPPSIASRLKAAPDAPIADRFESVTVLFADIVGFTPLSARLSPEATVEILNEIFTAFDAICERHGAEKIKTIGDGYMAVCGAPQPREDHAGVMARVALEMRDFMASQPTGEPLQVRIGLNTGPALGGIVGTSRFHYDLWSDAVNTAARMESHGEPGRVHITRATWERVRDRFLCEPRGVIQVKGKGALETWFLGDP
jgi:class 3 adenylate cyclase